MACKTETLLTHSRQIINEKETHTKNLYAFLGVFTKSEETTISFVMSVCLSDHPSAGNNLAPTGWILMKFYISELF